MKKLTIPTGIARRFEKNLLKMKLTATLFFVSLVAMSATSYSQSTRFDISMSGKNIIELFREIEAKGNFYFFYQKEELKDLNSVTVSRKNANVIEILDEVLEGTGLSYKVIDRYVIVTRSENLGEMERVTVSAQQSAVSGTVTEKSGAPLPGVTVVIKGTTTGTITGSDGRFMISNIPPDATLVFSFVGMRTEEVIVGNQSTINLTMMEDAIGIEEVVAIGYGTARKIDLTGSLARIDVAEHYAKPNVNVVQSLKNSVAGVRVTDGLRAGSDGSIVIRGLTSITASNTPLIVLDGIPYTGGSLSDINSNDIESIDILKDASSAAIYGSRATNGVILITTKRGKTAKPTLTVNAYYGLSDFSYTPKLLGPEKYLQLKQDAAEFVGQTQPFPLHPLEQANLDKGIYTNPWEVVSQDSPMMSYDISMAGRNETVTYFVSGSYTDMKSIIYGDNFQRLALRTNLDVKVTDWLNIGTNSGYSVKDYSGTPADLLFASYQSPYAEYFYEDGVPRYYTYGEALATNPLFNTMQSEGKDITSNLFSNIYAEIALPLSGLTYRVNVANNLRNDDNLYYAPALNRDVVRLGAGSQTHNRFHAFTLENIVKYNQTFNKIHNVDATVMYGIESSLNEVNVTSSNNIFNDALSYYGLGLGENPKITTSAVDQKAVSAMARVGYRLMDKYMLNLTIRNDGFSAFGNDHKYGTFPSAGIGWVISQEKFMSDAKWLQLLKIRYSYGKNGNRGIAPYSSLSSISHSGNEYVFGDGSTTIIGIVPTTMANPALGWESTVASNLGIDFNLFENRIGGSFEYYNMDTEDLLLNLSIPNMNGFDKYLTNIGATNNYGFEATINSQNVRTGDFTWTTDVIFSLNRNKITRLAGVDIDGDGKEDDDIASRRFIGYPLFSNFNYVMEGVWQEGDDFTVDPTAKPGYLKFKDISGPDGVPDGKIGPEDRKVLHSSQPDFLLGLTNTWAYKSLSFSFALDGRFGGYSADALLNPGTNFYDRTNILDVPYWTKANPGNKYASVGYSNPRAYGFYASRTFVRLQDINLMYNLPAGLISKAKVNSAKVYISGKNMATWTNWKNWDPETGAGGRNNNGVLLKSWVVGVNIIL